MVSQSNIGIIDGWTLPWPEIRIPPYRPGRVGAWELKRQVQPVLRGYFRGLQACTENYVLVRDNRVWMSLSPVEVESLGEESLQATGDETTVSGLGTCARFADRGLQQSRLAHAHPPTSRHS